VRTYNFERAAIVRVAKLVLAQRVENPFVRLPRYVVQYDKRVGGLGTGRHRSGSTSLCGFVKMVKGIFSLANASSAASGTKCSPDLSTRPEKRPSKKDKARFSTSRSGNLTLINGSSRDM
jgi:hypothetical protein